MNLLANSKTINPPVEYPGLEGSKKVYLFMWWALGIPFCLSLLYNLCYSSDISLPDSVLAICAWAIPSVDTIYQRHLALPADERVAMLLNNVAFATAALCLLGGALLMVWVGKLATFYKANQQYIYSQEQVEERHKMLESKNAIPILFIGGIGSLALPFVLSNFLVKETYTAYLICLYGGTFMLSLSLHIWFVNRLLNNQKRWEN